MLTQLSGESVKHRCPRCLQFSDVNNHRIKMFQCPWLKRWADMGLSFKPEGNRGATAAERRAETTEAIEYWEESGVAIRCCARGLGKHLERAFAPLASAKI